MTVALPTNGTADATMRFLDRGGVLKAMSGGSDQRLDRMGSRWGGTFQTKPMEAAEARIWIARLVRGVSEKASIRFPQPGLAIPMSGDYVVAAAAAANATLVQIGLSGGGVADVGKSFVEGQFVTIIKAGIRYVHQITADVVIGGGASTASIAIQPPLRVALVGAEVVEVLNPRIEGFVSGNSGGQEWNVSNAKLYGLQFDIEEAK